MAAPSIVDKRRMIVMLLFALFTHISGAQETFFTFTEGFRSNHVVEIDDGYLSLGIYAQLLQGVGQRHVFTRLSDQGDVVSSQILIDDSLTVIQTILSNSILHEDSTLVTAGFGRSDPTEEHAYSFVQRFDLTGDVEELSSWAYPLLDYGAARTIDLHSEEGYLVSFLFRDNNEDFLTRLYHIDPLGNIIWQQDFYSDVGEVQFVSRLEPYHLMLCPDGGYLLTCIELNDYTHPFTEKLTTVLLKTDSLGNEQWRIRPGDWEQTWIDPGWPVMLDDGNFMFFWTDPYVIEPTLDGLNFENTIRYAEYSLVDGALIDQWDLMDVFPTFESDPEVGHLYTLTQSQLLDNGDILISGYDAEPGLLCRIDQEGEVIWSRLIMPEEYQGLDISVKAQIYGTTSTSDGGFVSTGEFIADPYEQWPSGIQSAFVMKLDEYGCLEPGCQLIDDVSLEEYDIGRMSIYPNPGAGIFTIHTPVDWRGAPVQLDLYDMLGRLLLSLDITGRVANTLDLSHLSSGLYELQAWSGLKRASGKLLIRSY